MDPPGADTDPEQFPDTKPYQYYTYNGAGEPVKIDRRDKDAVAGGQRVINILEWVGMGKLRRVVSTTDYGTPQAATSESYKAGHDFTGHRASSTLGTVSHTYSYSSPGGSLLHDSAASGPSTLYTPGVSQTRGGVDGYFHEDWLGSTRYVTASNGTTTNAWHRYDAPRSGGKGTG